MADNVLMTVDGAGIEAPKGTTVLDAALEYGICIPHLCHVRGLLPIGSCRLCIVEVVEGKRRKVTASCTLEVRDGMVVEANSEKIQRLRRNLAELLVAEAPSSRAVQDMAARCGVTDVRYPFRNKDCILCERCVRVCSEMWQGHAVGAVGRGKNRQVQHPFGTRPDTCKMCLACVDMCPMTILPCIGPFEPGEERLCGQCGSQLTMAEELPGACVKCELGRGFHCTRQRV